MYTKEDYEKDRDFIRQYDGVKFQFPRTDRTGKKVNILYRIPHLNGLYIESGAYGDVFGVCYNENEYNLAEVEKEVDKYRKNRLLLKQLYEAMQRVKMYEPNPAVETRSNKLTDAVFQKVHSGVGSIEFNNQINIACRLGGNAGPTARLTLHHVHINPFSYFLPSSPHLYTTDSRYRKTMIYNLHHP